jgi:hypothetical protein
VGKFDGNQPFTVGNYHCRMLQDSHAAYPAAQWVALEGCAQSAGHALACAFSSSDEYEAALIAERRAEGRYGPRRPRMLITATAIALATAVVIALIV